MPSINLLPVVVSTVLTMVCGMVWYSKPVFGNLWIKHSGINPADPAMKQGMARAFTMAIVSTLVFTYALAGLLALAATKTLEDALGYGLLWMLAIALPIHSNAIGWEHRSPTLVLINAGWTTFSTFLAVLIIVLWPA